MKFYIKVFLLAILMTFVLSSVAQAATTNEGIKSPPKKSTGKIKGTKKGGGCEYMLIGAIRPREGNEEIRVRGEIVEQDVSNCEATVTQEESSSLENLPLDPLSELPPGGSSSGLKKQPSEAALTSSLRIGKDSYSAFLVSKMGSAPKLIPTGLVWKHSVGRMHTWLEDPVHADVNHLITAVDWYWNGYQVHSPSAVCGDWLWWLKETGWRNMQDVLTCTYYPNEQWIDSMNWTFFQNDRFCWPLPPTRVFYYDHHATGAGTGWFYPYTMVYTDGGCNSWLHTHYEYWVAPS